MQLFAEPLIAEDLKCAKKYIKDWELSEWDWLEVHLNRDSFASRLNSVLKSNNDLELANLLRFPSQIIVKYTHRELKEDFLNRFSLRFWFWEENYYIQGSSKIYWKTSNDEIMADWNNSIFLFFEDKPIALISIRTYNQNIIVIEQIQWINWEKKHFEIEWFDWRKFFVEVVEVISKKLWFDIIWIIPANFSKWLIFHHLFDRHQEFEKWWKYFNIYDQVALDMWYENSSRNPIYTKSL